MNSRTTERVRRAFDALPRDVQLRARRSHRRVRENSFHPSLRFKQVPPNGSMRLMALRAPPMTNVGREEARRMTTKAIAGGAIHRLPPDFRGTIESDVAAKHLRAAITPRARIEWICRGRSRRPCC